MILVYNQQIDTIIKHSYPQSYIQTKENRFYLFFSNHSAFLSTTGATSRCSRPFFKVIVKPVLKMCCSDLITEDIGDLSYLPKKVFSQSTKVYTRYSVDHGS